MTRAYLAFAFLCVVFGTTFGAIKIGLADGWPPLLAAGLRFTLAGLLVLIVAGIRAELRPLRPVHVLRVAAVGISVTAGTFGTLYSAESVLSSGLAALLAASSPLFAVAIDVVAQRRRFDRFVAGGVLLGTLGVAFVGGVTRLAGITALAAAGAIIVSEFGYAWGLGYAKAVRADVPTLQLAGAQQLIGGAILLALSAAFERRGVAHLTTGGVASLVYLIVVASAGAHTVTLWLAARTDATFAASWTYVAPFIALGFGALLLGEPLGPWAWIGGACVVAGAFALNLKPRGSDLHAGESRMQTSAAVK